MSNEAKDFLKWLKNIDLDDSKTRAAALVKRIPAPMGLSEWKTTDGRVYMSCESAVNAQEIICKMRG